MGAIVIIEFDIFCYCCAEFILCKLHTGEYIIRVANEYEGRREAVYELQEKGYGVLEDYRRQAIYAYGPMLISLTALVISILSYFR